VFIFVFVEARMILRKKDVVGRVFRSYEEFKATNIVHTIVSLLFASIVSLIVYVIFGMMQWVRDGWTLHEYFIRFVNPALIQIGGSIGFALVALLAIVALNGVLRFLSRLKIWYRLNIKRIVYTKFIHEKNGDDREQF